MQYQVLIDPTKLAGAGLTVPRRRASLAREQRQRGRRVLLRGRAVLLRARPGPCRHAAGHRQHRASPSRTARPVLVKDIAQVVIGYAPRLGQFGYDSADDAVEGVILMRTGEQAQTVLKRVEAATD